MKPGIGPIGLDYLADALAQTHHEPQLLDLCFSEQSQADIEKAVCGYSPDLIGVTIRNTDDCYFNCQAFFLPDIKRVIGWLRQWSDAPVVLGGAGFSVAPFAVMDFCEAEFGIAGEGEPGLIALLNALERRSNLADTPGLLCRDGGSIHQNSNQPVNLSEAAPRRRAFVDNALYFAKGGQAGFETKRGCGCQCIYCADPVVKGRAVRLLPPQAVVAELSELVGRGIDHFHTCDSEFNLPKEHALDVCRAIIDAGLGDRIRWFAYCSVTPFDNEMADLFKRAGCAGIDFGADSGCDEMLRRLRRHYTCADLHNTAQLCHKHNIPFMYDLLVGGPGETPDSVRRTIELMRSLDVDCVGLSIGMRVYDGTPVAQQIRAEGDLDANPNLYGAKHDNPHFLKPVFYVSPHIGENIFGYVQELVASDTRFFLPDTSAGDSNYNYNDNTVLVRAIENGARGAYWDILRRMSA